ncbi:hypothetical protein KG089_05325 [Carnobacteriaceae bacterium zg-ZUI252]|nr:hypothetical protein [Carnobacteriaceae bacterium zg-ZUI252]
MVSFLSTYEELEKFKPTQKTTHCSKDAKEMAREILELVHTKRLTYIEAYASLEEVYETLRFESNFVNVQLVPHLEKPEQN